MHWHLSRELRRKKLLAAFFAPLDKGQGGNTGRPETGEHKAHRTRTRQKGSRNGAAGGGAKRRQRRGTKAKGGRTPTKGAADKRTNPGHARTRAAAETSQNFLLCERLKPPPKLRIIKILRHNLSATSFAAARKTHKPAPGRREAPTGEHKARPQPDETQARTGQGQPVRTDAASRLTRARRTQKPRSPPKSNRLRRPVGHARSPAPAVDGRRVQTCHRFAAHRGSTKRQVGRARAASPYEERA